MVDVRFAFPAPFLAMLRDCVEAVSFDMRGSLAVNTHLPDSDPDLIEAWEESLKENLAEDLGLLEKVLREGASRAADDQSAGSENPAVDEEPGSYGKASPTALDDWANDIDNGTHESEAQDGDASVEFVGEGDTDEDEEDDDMEDDDLFDDEDFVYVHISEDDAASACRALSAIRLKLRRAVFGTIDDETVEQGGPNPAELSYEAQSGWIMYQQFSHLQSVLVRAIDPEASLMVHWDSIDDDEGGGGSDAEDDRE